MSAADPASGDPERGPRDRVVQEIRRLIAGDGISADDRVPTVRELAQRLGVDKGTVVRAYRHLEGLGVVRRRGSGPRARLVVAGDGDRPAPFSDLVAVVSNHSADMASRYGVQTGREAGQLAGVLEVLTAAHRPALVVSPDLFAANGRRWLGDGLSGVIVLHHPGGPGEALLASHAGRAPVVADSAFMAAPWCIRVAHDHAAGTAALVALLAGEGRRRILPVGFPEPLPPWAARRLAGYRAACIAAGLSCLEPLGGGLLGDDMDELDFHRQARAMVGTLIEHLVGPRAVDGILTVSDGWVPTVIEAARLAGRRVHEDLAVCGYDNAWSWTPERAWCATPPFATIDKDNRGRGRREAELLLDALGGAPVPPGETIVPFQLMRPA